MKVLEVVSNFSVKLMGDGWVDHLGRREMQQIHQIRAVAGIAKQNEFTVSRLYPGIEFLTRGRHPDYDIPSAQGTPYSPVTGTKFGYTNLQMQVK